MFARRSGDRLSWVVITSHLTTALSWVRSHRAATAVRPAVAVTLLLLFRPAGPVPSTSVHAQAPGSPLVGKTWVRTGGPMGGRGYDIRMRPDNLDVMYATEQFSGIHKSVDGGRTWFPINNGIDARAGTSGDGIPTFCLTIDPNNYDIIWAGTLGYRGVYRSTDGGATWEKRTNGIVENMDLTLRGFAIEPGNSNVVYAAGEINLGKRVWYDATKGVVYKTTDGGLHWNAIWRGDNLARYVLIDPTNVNTLYVSTGIWDREAANSNLAANEPGGVGILKSTDGGTTWRTINNGLKNLYVGSLFMHPADPQVLLAGTGFGFYRTGNGAYMTTDGGEHWTQVLETADTPEDSTPVTSVEISTTDPNIMWAGGIGFWRSNDGGSSWTRYWGEMGFWGPSGIRLGNPIDFQADPRNPDRLFTNNYNGGNVLSEDGGKTWVESTMGYTGATVTSLTVDAQNAATVFASEKGGPYRTANAGELWSGVNRIRGTFPVPGAAKIAIDPADSTHVVMAENKDARVYESHDAGNSWDLIVDYRDEMWTMHGAGATEGMLAIAFAPSRPQRVYGGFGWYVCGQHWPEGMVKQPIVSLLMSEDSGHTWTRRTGTALDRWSIEQIVVHPTNADAAWAATAGGGVFRTTDGGTTWQSVSSGLGTLVETSLAMNPRDPNVLYAGSVRGGVFKTANGGATWQAVNAGMNPNDNVISVVVDPVRPNVVYAGSEFSGVYVTEDAGTSWRLLNNGLRTRAVEALAISNDGMVLYAGTDGDGVFRLGDVSTPPVTTQPADQTVPSSQTAPRNVVATGAQAVRDGGTDSHTRPENVRPTGLAAAASGSGVVLTWTAPSGAKPLRYAIGGGQTRHASTLPVIVTSDASTHYTIPAVPPGAYHFRVFAILAGVVTPPSDDAAVLATGSLSATGPPRAALATADAGMITAAWTGAPGAATYQVEIGLASGLGDVATLTTTETSLTYRAPPATYYLRVRAVRGPAVSAPSNDVSLPIAAAACTAAPSRPILLPVSTVNGEATISWLPARGAPATRYRVDGLGPSGPVVIHSAGAGTSVAAALIPGVYSIRVTASNACGASTASNQMEFTVF